jgi:hypothetical protein
VVVETVDVLLVVLIVVVLDELVNVLFVLLLEIVDDDDADRHCEYEELMIIHADPIQHVDPDQFAPLH